jgi:hypothetical protein
LARNAQLALADLSLEMGLFADKEVKKKTEKKFGVAAARLAGCIGFTLTPEEGSHLTNAKKPGRHGLHDWVWARVYYYFLFVRIEPVIYASMNFESSTYLSSLYIQVKILWTSVAA